MAGEAATMELPNEEIAGGSGRYTQAVAEEEKPGVGAILLWRGSRARMMSREGSVRRLKRLLGLPKVWAVVIKKR